MRRSSRFGHVVITAALACVSSGCNQAAKRVGDHFLEALSRDDYAAAYADLHAEARADTPSVDALRSRVEKGGARLVSWYANCGASGDLSRIGYNVTSAPRPTTEGATRPVVIGVPPLRRGKCNGPLVVDLKVDPSSPDKGWRVRSFQWN